MLRTQVENNTTVVAALVCQSLIISPVPLSKFHIPYSALPCKDKVKIKHKSNTNFTKQRQGLKLTPTHPHEGLVTDCSLHMHSNLRGSPRAACHHCCFTTLPKETETISHACLKSHSKLAPRSIPPTLFTKARCMFSQCLAYAV